MEKNDLWQLLTVSKYCYTNLNKNENVSIYGYVWTILVFGKRPITIFSCNSNPFALSFENILKTVTGNTMFTIPIRPDKLCGFFKHSSEDGGQSTAKRFEKFIQYT